MSARWSRLKSWLRSITHRNRVEARMEDEILFHLEARATDLTQKGLSPREAMRQARIEFGAIPTHKDAMRHSLNLRWWDDLLADLRYAARTLRKSPGFTAIAVASLALAIGANTTIFSVANEILYERLGVPHPEQLQLLTITGDKNLAIHSFWGNWDSVSDGRTHLDSFTYPSYLQLRANNHVLQDIFAFKDIGRANITLDGTASALQVELVSGNFYQQMDVRPALGRAILPSDDGAPSTGAVAIISDGLWQRSFGRSPSVIGKVISVNMTPVTIIGVNPRGFTGAQSVQSSPEIFMPLSMIPLLKGSMGETGTLLSSPNFAWVQLMARSKPGVPIEQARTALDTILTAAIRGTITVAKDDTMPRLELEDGSRGLNRATLEFGKPLHVLLALVGFVLLLACANIANLMLARASARQHEMGVRLALGASRSRILRQVFTESLLLSTLGGIFGLVLSYLGRTVLPQLVANSWERVELNVPFNWKVCAFTAGITILTGILFGIAPAWAATRAEVGTALKESGSTATRRRKGFTGKAIVAFQVALSTLLVVGAALFLRTLFNLNSINPGFRTDHLVLFDINPPNLRYPVPKDIALHRQLEQALAAVPGVDGVTLTTVPLLAGSMSNGPFSVEGATPSNKNEPTTDSIMARDQSDTSMYLDVGTRFFSVVGLPIVAGRNFTPQDTETSHQVSVINRTTAKQFFPNTNPIGKRFSFSTTHNERTKWFEIVGICADTPFPNLRDQPPPLHFDLYHQQTAAGGMTYAIRTSMKPEAIVPSLRAAIQKIDRDLPLIDVRTQQQQIDTNTQQERIFASLSAGFGLLALALACVGIYGIMAYTVSQRTNEIGIRLALGAHRQQVGAMVLRQATRLTILGITIGVAASLALSRLVKSMLYGLQPTDPISIIGAATLLLAVAMFASWIPALRASRVEPIEALRHE
ncbi:MAG TPA: ABC transporter permease [Edaphobacter sp.]|nr:ABC transporter permease [Edaphobacter sp.]